MNDSRSREQRQAPVDRLRTALADSGHPVNRGMARCPAHEDRDPSLSIRSGAEGRALVHCHAGCDPADVLSAIGLTMADLFRERETMPALKVVRHVYTDAEGAEVVTVSRPGANNRKCDRPQGIGNAEVPLYRLPEVLAACRAGETVWVVEGEKCADALAREGICGTTNIGGAGKWLPHLTRQMAGAQEVIVVGDNDEAGKDHAQQVVRALRSAGVTATAHLCAHHGGRKGYDVADQLGEGNGLDLVALADPGPALRTVPDLAGGYGQPGTALLDLGRGRRGADEDDAVEPEKPLDYPVGALPPMLARWVAAAARSAQSPPDFPAMAALAAVSYSASSLILDYLPDSPTVPSLWFFGLAHSGTAKSRSMAMAKRPTMTIRAMLRSEWQAGCEAMDEAGDKSQHPRKPTVAVSNLTMAGLMWALRASDERVVAMAPEGGPLVETALRGGHGASAETVQAELCSIWSGETIERLRATNHDMESYELDRPRLSMVALIQPGKLDGLLADAQGSITSGFFARILWSFPGPTDQSDPRPPGVPKALQSWYQDMVVGVWQQCRHLDGVVVGMDPDASSLVDAFHRRTERVTTPGLAEASARRREQVLRLALAIHVVDSWCRDVRPWDLRVTDGSVTKALIIESNHWHTAMRVYPRLSAGMDLEALYGTADNPDSMPPGSEHILRVLSEMITEDVLVRTLQRRVRRQWCRTYDDFLLALTWLDNHGYITLCAVGGWGSGRSHSVRITEEGLDRLAASAVESET